MAIRATSIRLFVSSTFGDFKRERAILDREVFPLLRRYCAARGFEFQAVDLRWGISEQLSETQKTLAVCLHEVALCVQSSLRPYFVVLLGDRYGWQPVPDEIEKAEFEQLRHWVDTSEGSDAAASLRRWYLEDVNHIPPVYVLQPRSIDKAGRWKDAEQALRDLLRRAVVGAGVDEAAARKYFLSATAREIEAGIFDVGDQQSELNQHVLCFVRRMLPGHEAASQGAAIDADRRADGSVDPVAQAWKEDLRDRIHDTLKDNFLAYDVGPGAAGAASYERRFQTDALRLLEGIVRSQVERLEEFRKHETEWDRHANFQTQLLEPLTGRVELIDRFDKFLDHQDRRGLLLHGPSGIGKSTLMARAVQMAAARKYIVLQRYVGTTSASTSGISLITSLIDELGSTLGEAPERGAEAKVLAQQFRRLASQAGQAYKVLIAIDALDQLPDDDPLNTMDWLPWPPPPGIALLVSVVDGDRFDDTLQRLFGIDTLAVGALEQASAQDLLRSALRQSDRTLLPWQEEHILARFSEEGKPLYLRVASEFAKKWRSYDAAPPISGDMPRGTLALVKAWLGNLSTLRGHEALLVERTFALLLASHDGLLESELLELLWADAGIRELVSKGRHGGGLDRLPMIYWSRLRDDISPFLSRTIRIRFFHGLFREAAAQGFHDTEEKRRSAHLALATYFDMAPLYIGDGTDDARPNERKLTELAYQWHRAGNAARLSELLASTGYFQAKLQAGLGVQLYGEYFECGRMLRVEDDVNEAVRAALATALADQVIQVLRSPRAGDYSIEEMHSGFAHRGNPKFYLSVLDHCIARMPGAVQGDAARSEVLQFELSARKINIQRRMGDLDAVVAALRLLVAGLHARSMLALASSVEYDEGYVAFLRGNLTVAATRFEKSADTGGAAGNAVSEWMSRSMAANARWLDAVSHRRHFKALPKFLATLSKAEEVFTAHVDSELHALRWLYNIRVHRFKAAFRVGDVNAARALVAKIRQDAWSASYQQQDQNVALVDSRMAMLERRYDVGAAILGKYAAQLDEASEGKAEQLFDLGFAYLFAGQRTEAQQAWHHGLKLAPHLGNVPWQKLIVQAVATWL